MEEDSRQDEQGVESDRCRGINGGCGQDCSDVQKEVDSESGGSVIDEEVSAGLES